MSWEEALELVIASTRHERFRWLCSEDNPNAEQRDSYRRYVVYMATGEQLAPPTQPTPFVVPPAYAMGWKHCLYATHEPGGCCGGALTCHWLRQVIPLQTCVDCLKEMS